MAQRFLIFWITPLHDKIHNWWNFLAPAGQLCIRTPLIKLWFPWSVGIYLVNYEPIENHKTIFFKSFSLLSKGRQILMKDNLIDEERAKQEEAAQESLEQKLERLGKKNVTLWELLSSFLFISIEYDYFLCRFCCGKHIRKVCKSCGWLFQLPS